MKSEVRTISAQTAADGMENTELSLAQKKLREDTISQLVRARRMKNLTQNDLAAVTGIQRSNLSRLESNQYNPTLDMLARVADGLGLQVKIILEDKQ